MFSGKRATQSSIKIDRLLTGVSIPPTMSTPNTTSVERIRRKKHVPDTTYLKTPKVVPGGAVVCISRLPHGFYESELCSFLSQFGEVTRLRLSRNPRTGASRHYAFVEFRHSDVARIVTETMNNYLLAGHLLQCRLMGEEQIHREIWKGAGRKFVKIPWRKMEAKRYNARNTGKEIEKRIKRKKRELQEQEIGYDVDGILTEL